MLVPQLLEQEEQAGGEQEREAVQVEEVRAPCRRLVLGHGRNDRDVLLGVRRVPQRVEAACPRRDVASVRERHERRERCERQDRDARAHQHLELRGRHVPPHGFRERNQLQQAKHAERGHVLGRTHGLEPDKGDLHASERSDRVERRVRHVQPLAKAAHEDEHQGVQRDHVGDKHVATPRGNHVKVRERCEHAKEHAAVAHRAHPQIEREQQQKDGDGLVIVRACD